MEAFGVVVRVRPDDGPPAVMATFAALVGYPGLNGAGVAHFQNALANGVWRHALPHYPLKRVLLEQLPSWLPAPPPTPLLASCGNYVIGDGQRLLVDVEFDAKHRLRRAGAPARDVVVHTNHFQSQRFPRLEERFLDGLPDPVLRLERMRALLTLAQHGRITLQTVQQCLRHHEGGPGQPSAVTSRWSGLDEDDRLDRRRAAQGRLHVARVISARTTTSPTAWTEPGPPGGRHSATGRPPGPRGPGPPWRSR